MHLVDTDRYPLDRIDSGSGQAFVAECINSFAADGAVVLPGFLTDAAVAAIADEARGLTDEAFSCHSEHTVFLDHEASGNGEQMLQTRVSSIANDLLDPQGVLQRLYEWEPLTSFIGAVLGYDSFHRGEDPLGALSINVYGQGDLHEWHFDESRFSVTVMIQEAEHGGHFEYIHGLRTHEHVDGAGIQRVLEGDEAQVKRLPFTTGSLSIFAGRNTMHRVTEVAGARQRLVPVLTYDTQPGSVNSEAVRRLFWGRAS